VLVQEQSPSTKGDTTFRDLLPSVGTIGNNHGVYILKWQRVDFKRSYVIKAMNILLQFI
jgi:hypothetical protein